VSDQTGHRAEPDRRRAVAAELTWHGGEFRADFAVEYSERSGRIRRVLPAEDAAAAGVPVERLRGRALLPGFVNAHSHAFQRLIRGRTQWRPAADPAADFWTWRDAMYRAALRLSPDEIYDAARFCFIEMLRAGYTAVGEFHYLHRDPAGQPYDDPSELAMRVVGAASDAGIRIRLLNAAYVTGGIGQPLAREQRRFATPNLELYLRDTLDLFERVAKHPLASAGVAPHSLRAVPRDWLAPVHSLAYGYDAPVHIHAAEQPKEVAACLAAYGRRPVELLAETGVLDEQLTVVHATHVNHREVELLGLPGPIVCACPTTERDLGDGILPAEELLAAGATIALGSDSNTVIDPFDEMRAIEYHERLRKMRRVVLATAPRGDRREVAANLIEMATRSGARALRLDAGELRTGWWADFVAVDLGHRTLEGWTAAVLPALLALCAPADVVTDVWTGGVRRVADREHAGEDEAAVAFRAAAASLGD